MILPSDGPLGNPRCRAHLPCLILACGALASCAVVSKPTGIAPEDAASRAATADAAQPQVQGAEEGHGALPAKTDPAQASPGGEAAGEEGADQESAEDCVGECEEGADDAEAEAHEVAPPGDHTLRYTADLSEGDIEQRFVHDLSSLGSVSLGFVDEGRLLNSMKMPEGETWDVIIPEYAYGTAETIQALQAVADAVHAAMPNAARLRVNRISRKDGGWLRPHRSHQNGRDVDLGLFYKNNRSPGGLRGLREKLIDPAFNWALIRALVTLSDVQLILVDRRIQKVIYDYALSIGEDRAWVDSIFRAGPDSLVKHARRHRDHFHVRFFCPRSQELGRRVQPLLARRPDQNFARYRVRNGDNLGRIARRFGSSVSSIRRANHLKSSFLRASQVLVLPLRGPCTRCPLPAPVIVPPRRLPPEKPTEPVAKNPPSPPEPQG